MRSTTLWQAYVINLKVLIRNSLLTKVEKIVDWPRSSNYQLKWLSSIVIMHFQCRCLCLMSWIKSTKGMMGYSTEVQVSCYIINKQPLPTELWRWSSLSLWLVSWSVRITCALNLCISQLEHHGNVFGLRPIWSSHIKLHIHEVIHLHGNWQRVFTVPTHWGLTDRNHRHHSYPNAGIHISYSPPTPCNHDERFCPPSLKRISLHFTVTRYSSACPRP